jgi:hypothetical protein
VGPTGGEVAQDLLGAAVVAGDGTAAGTCQVMSSASSPGGWRCCPRRRRRPPGPGRRPPAAARWDAPDHPRFRLPLISHRRELLARTSNLGEVDPGRQPPDAQTPGSLQIRSRTTSAYFATQARQVPGGSAAACRQGGVVPTITLPGRRYVVGACSSADIGILLESCRRNRRSFAVDCCVHWRLTWHGSVSKVSRLTEAVLCQKTRLMYPPAPWRRDGEHGAYQLRQGDRD